MNENMRRNMEFIVEQQAKFAASMERLEEERVKDQPRQAELQKSFQTVVELLRIQESRLDRSKIRLDRAEFDIAGVAQRTKTLEVNMAALAAAQAHADERLSALINIVMEDRGRAS
jgi:chromosome segregation ATPase